MALVASLVSTVCLASACGGGDAASNGATAEAESSADTSVEALRRRNPAPAPAPAPAPTVTAALSWSPSTSANVAKYRVYYGTQSKAYTQSVGNGVAAGNNTTYTVSGLASGTTYYFAVTAVDDVGAESALSSEASKLVR